MIPPIDATSPTSVERSPYIVSLNDFVLRFGTSTDRCRILDDLLRYRAGLHAAGLSQGFHWLDGSFLERVEVIESHPPNDIDVVTFYRLPTGVSQVDFKKRAPHLFPANLGERTGLKETYFVDPHLVNLGSVAERLVTDSAYWYSLWSHRRDRTWKGYVQVDLNGAQDATAVGILGTLGSKGGWARDRRPGFVESTFARTNTHPSPGDADRKR